MKKSLYSLFKRCLRARYIRTAESGDYAIQIERDTLYLLFQKSNGGTDWLNNFRFGARPYKRMKDTWRAHRGFLRVWKAMRDEVGQKVAEKLTTHNIKNIVVVGYSHGGALALLATEDMAYLYGDLYTVKGYGFGAPRVLWGKVPDSVKKRLENFTVVRNVPDLVTHLPPAIWGYRHVGRMEKVGYLGKYGPLRAHFPTSYVITLREELRR